jgi:hypothetical protein
LPKHANDKTDKGDLGREIKTAGVYRKLRVAGM